MSKTINVDVGDSILVGPQGPQGIQGIQGPEGKSAYEVAVRNGFEGTEEEWLNSLKVAIDDSKTATDTTWSSEKINNQKANNVELFQKVEIDVTVGRNYVWDKESPYYPWYEGDYLCYGKGNVIPGSKIKATGFSQGSDEIAAFNFLNSNDEVVSTEWISSGPHRDVELNVPSEATQIIINGSSNRESLDHDNYVYPSLSTVTYSSLKDYLENMIINSNIINSKLYGKSISFNGDSIMYGQGFAGGFAKMVADKYNMTYENVAVPGATIAYTTNESVYSIAKGVLSMNENADYVICEGGYNDYTYKEPLGEITEGMSSTINNKQICGGMEQLCRNLLSRFEGKKIGFIFTHKIKNSDYTYIEDWNGQGGTRTLRQIHDKQVEILKKYSIPYLDLYNESCLNTELESYLKYTQNNDGTHPTEEGYKKFYLDKVISFLESL